MRLLITGGAGFMGSNFIRYILNKYTDYEVVNVDKLTYSGNLENLKDLSDSRRYKFVKGDICDQSLIEENIKGVDAVINYAAQTHVDRSIMDTSSFVKTDVLGLQNLLEESRKRAISKFIQISTDEVFGSIEEGKFKEDSSFMPNSPYAASKAGGDLLCRSYAITYKMPIIVTHSCNFFGPYHYPEKFIPLAIVNLVQGKKVPLYGDGQNVREWIYTEDHCRAIDAILHKGRLGEVYNISTEEQWCNIDVVRLILKIMGKGEDSVTYVKDRPGHDFRYALDAGKIKKDLLWRPSYKFKDALIETVDWFRNNGWWWRPIVESQDYKSYYEKQYHGL